MLSHLALAKSCERDYDSTPSSEFDGIEREYLQRQGSGTNGHRAAEPSWSRFLAESVAPVGLCTRLTEMLVLFMDCPLRLGGGERHETLNRVSEDVPAPKGLQGSRLPHPGPLPRTKVSSMSDSGMGGKDGRFEEDTDLTHPT